MKKFTSYRERTLDTPRQEYPVNDIIYKRMTTRVVYDENSKRYIRKTELSTVDRAKEMANYRASDFSLENLTAVGAKLQPCSLPSSSLGKVENLENTLASIIDNSANETSNE